MEYVLCDACCSAKATASNAVEGDGGERTRVLLPAHPHPLFLADTSDRRWCLTRSTLVYRDDISGLTALMGAASKGHLDVLRLLVEEEGIFGSDQEGGSLDAKDKGGHTALGRAINYGFLDCARYLLECQCMMRSRLV